MLHFKYILYTLLLFQSLFSQNVTTLVPGPSTFNDGLARDQNGNIFASYYYGGRISKITPAGEVSVFASGLQDPNGLLVDANNNLLVAHANGNNVLQYNSEGTQTVIISNITNPTGLLYDLDGNLLIAQYQLSTISQRDSSGNVTTFMSGGLLNGPVGLDMDESGNLYIGNFTDGRVLKRTPDGEISVIGDLPGWLGFITYSNGYVYATAYQRHKIYRIPTDGSGQEIFAGTGNAGQVDGDISVATFNNPNGIIASPDGDTLFISDYGTRSLRMITGLNAVTGELEEWNAPEHFEIIANYPNPFNPSTTIRYVLPEQSMIRLTVFDVQGYEITTIQDGVKQTGTYDVQWNGLDRMGNQVSTGVYFCQLKAGNYSETIKMLYLR